MSSHWSDFREYRRGRFMGDFTSRVSSISHNVRVEGSAIDRSHRNRILLDGSGTRTVHTWNAPDLDTGKSNQEILALVRFTGTSISDRGVLILRQHATADTCYRALLLPTTQAIRVERRSAGVATTLVSGSKTLKAGVFYIVYFAVSGSTLTLRVWPYSESMPGVDITAVDATHTDGYIGFESTPAASSTEQWEIYYLSVGTNGTTPTSPDPTLLTEPLDSWIAEPDEELETVLRFEHYNPLTNSVVEEWYSSHGRTSTSYYDYPSSTAINPLPSWPDRPYELGDWSTGLEADLQLGGAASISRSAMKFCNQPTGLNESGPFDHWLSKSLANRPVERRLGKRWLQRPTPANPEGVLNPLRRFEIVGCALVNREPSINPDECSIPLAAPIDILSKTIPVYRNVGISTCIQTLSNTGYILIPNHSLYGINSFCVYCRIFVPTTGVAGSTRGWFSRRFTGASFQWSIAVGYASHATIANKLNLLVHATDDTVLIDYTHSTTINDGLNHDVIFGIDDKRRYYLIIDGIIVTTGTPAKSVKQPGTSVELLRVLPNCTIFDHRIERYVPEDEALARFSSRRDPDLITLSMHRVDDNVSNTVTDYASIANHATLQGVDGVDWSWVPTYLGSSELSGVSMPFSGGVIYHAPTQEVDPVRGVFRYNDRLLTAGSAVNVRAKGLLLTGGGVSYSEPPDGPGTVDFVGAIDRPITFGLSASPSSPEAETIHVPRLVRDELYTRRALNHTNLDSETFYGLRKLLPMKGGFLYTDPPTVGKFLTDNLGSIGSYYSICRDARVHAGCMLPPVNEGPYRTIDTCLEFIGLPNRGVTINPHSSYSLKQSNTWSVQAWVKFHRHPLDASTSGTFTYFPSGMTIIDHVDGATGYYLGIDGRTGYIVFGAPGVTGTVSGLHYLTYNHLFEMEKWYLIQGYQDINTRIIRVGVEGETTITRTTSESTAGTMSASDSTPIRIGHGPRGSFHGSIQYAIGSSSARNESSMATNLSSAPTVTNTGSIVDRWSVGLRDGSLGESPVDRVVESVQSKYGIAEGVRWCPKLHIDLRKSATMSLSDISVPAPIWRLEDRYKLNRSVLTGANVAGGVSAADRIALSLSYLSEIDSSIGIRDNYLTSKEVATTTPLLTSADSDYVARLTRQRIATDKRFSTVEDMGRELLRLDLSDEVILWYTRFGLDVGLPIRLAILRSNAESLVGSVVGVG